MAETWGGDSVAIGDFYASDVYFVIETLLENPFTMGIVIFYF